MLSQLVVRANAFYNIFLRICEALLLLFLFSIADQWFGAFAVYKTFEKSVINFFQEAENRWLIILSLAVYLLACQLIWYKAAPHGRKLNNAGIWLVCVLLINGLSYCIESSTLSPDALLFLGGCALTQVLAVWEQVARSEQACRVGGKFDDFVVSLFVARFTLGSFWRINSN